jgi:hypothetical protein
MEYFWKGGIQNLDKEMEIHKMLCSSLESTGEMDTAEESIEALRL